MTDRDNPDTDEYLLQFGAPRRQDWEVPTRDPDPRAKVKRLLARWNEEAADERP